ncbi:MAG: hypothetical protein JW787_16330 [Sedimentisphaerales bacterium]|nr:hypothetical protein [Sedimentisphaerales bacterium]
MLALCIVFTLFILTSCSETTKVSGVSLAPETVKQDLSEKIQGAWTLEKMDVGSEANRRTRDDAQFMIFILKNHYSAIRDLTEGSAQRSFAADAGKYEFDGKEVVVHHMLSAFGALGSMTFKCSMEGDDTLILEPQYDKMEMPGMGSMRPSSSGQMGYGDMAVRYVFKRLE